MTDSGLGCHVAHSPGARCRIETKIRLLSSVCLIVGLTQTFFDIFVLLTYRDTMGDFQVSWLFFNCFALVAQLVLLLYGFHAMAKQEYHSATNFRSWLLFIGTSLFFSGFFHIIGQCKDVQLFYTSCSHGFKASDHHERLPDDEAVLSHASCRTVSEEWGRQLCGPDYLYVLSPDIPCAPRLLSRRLVDASARSRLALLLCATACGGQ